MYAPQAVLREALAAVQATAANMAALSMHGTGTGLGDPIEVGAAAAVLLGGGRGANGVQPLAFLGSKTWVGHAEPAAGALSTVDTHVQHFTTCTDFMRFDHHPLYCKDDGRFMREAHPANHYPPDLKQ